MIRAAVYQDYVHNNGSLALALQDHDIDVIFVDANDINTGALNTVSVFIMPGGADLYYCEKLNGAGNAAIRDFVEQGGAYLGICAGAYYGCASLDWNNGEISGARELAFINAKAVGPVFDFIENGDIGKSWYGAVPLTWDGRTFTTLYGAGPVFENLPADTHIYASYAGGRPAVIGKGRVILSSPHLEVTGNRFLAGRYRHQSKSYDYEQNVGCKLAADAALQDEFFAFILERLISKA